jgi:processive 1,2-diacylglycerol beta-glucosyltransferase
MKKILITSVSAGAGHVRAAKAIEQYLKDSRYFEHHTQVEHCDLMNFSLPWFKYLYTDKYLDLINYFPSVWKALYHISDRPGLSSANYGKRLVQYHSHRKFLHYLKDYSPDLVISTHFLPPEILVKYRRKENLNFKIVVVVTDFDVHYLWRHNHVDYYMVAGQMAYDKLISLGIDKSKIIITGIPVMPAFFKSYHSQDIIEHYGFDTSKRQVLLMAGGAGVGELDEVAKEILEQHSNIQLIALAGKNQKLLADLQKLQKIFGTGIYPMGFTDKVHELMAISEMVVTKPGGLSTSECLALKKPMLLINPIPGQEEHNAHYLQNLGVAKLSQNFHTDFGHMLENLDSYKENMEKLTTYNTQDLMLQFFKKLL